MKYFMHAVLMVVLLAALFFACGRIEEPLQPLQTGDTALKPQTDASTAGGPTHSVDLVAARNEYAGVVTCWINGDLLFIEYATAGGWSLAETHCAVVEFLEEIPTTPSENPKLGHFPLKKKHAPFTEVHIESLDLNAWGFGEAEELIIAAHADVVMLSSEEEVLREEGAWGAGEFFLDIVPGDQHQIERPEQAVKGSAMKIDQHPRRGNWAMYFRVNVNELKGLLLWNKLGSVHEVTNSVVGPNGVIVGDVQFLPCKYGHGFRPLPRTGDRNIPDNYIEFGGLNLGQQGCIEFWYHPDFNNWTVGAIVDQFAYGVPCVHPHLPGYYIAAGYNDWADLWGAGTQEVVGDEYRGTSARARPTNIPGWTTAEPFHMAVTWDGTDSDPSQRLKLFIAGERVTPTDSGFSDKATYENFTPDAVLRLATRVMTGDWDRHHWDAHMATIDNLKVWSYPKVDFSDRFVE